MGVIKSLILSAMSTLICQMIIRRKLSIGCYYEIFGDYMYWMERNEYQQHNHWLGLVRVRLAVIGQSLLSASLYSLPCYSRRVKPNYSNCIAESTGCFNCWPMFATIITIMRLPYSSFQTYPRYTSEPRQGQCSSNDVRCSKLLWPTTLVSGILRSNYSMRYAMLHATKLETNVTIKSVSQLRKALSI